VGSAEKYDAGRGDSDISVILTCAARLLRDIKGLERLGGSTISSFLYWSIFNRTVSEFMRKTDLFRKDATQAMTDEEQRSSRLQTHMFQLGDVQRSIARSR
jgi:hypothetical protein